MKKIILMAKLLSLCLLVCLLAPQAIGQPTELANVTKQGFKGLKPMDKNGYYIQFIEGSKGYGKKTKTQLHLYVLDNDLKVSADFVMELVGQEKIEDVAYNGGNFLIIIGSAQAKTRTFKLVDKTGAEVAIKKFDGVKPQLLAKPAVILPVGDSDFIVLNYVKEKKVGYSVERYNNKLEMAYSQSQIPDKKKLYPVDSKMSGDRLYILEFLDSDNSDYFEYHIASYDVSNGTQTAKKYLTSADEKKFGFATFLKEGSDGSILTGGMYFDNPRIQKTNSDGFFAARFDKAGDLKFTAVDWETVEKTIKEGNSTVGIWGGKTKTFMHDLTVNADGTITLIGENYRRGDADLAGGKSKGLGIAMKVAGGDDDSDEAVTCAEFVLMDFDAQGNFVTCRKIDKPNAVTVVKTTQDTEDLPYIGQRKGLNLANILNNNGYLPYRFVVSNGSKSYIAFWQRYDPLIVEKLYFTPLGATKMDTTSIEVTGAELKAQQEFQKKAMAKLGGLGRLAKKAGDVTGSNYENYFELRGSHDPFDYRAKAVNTRVIPANVTGKIVIYDFIPDPPDPNEKKSFWSVQDTNGSLKVWHIDVPAI